jgi:hypothetical protein
MGETEDLRRKLYRRAGGMCECRRDGCRDHEPKRRCTNVLYSDSWAMYRLMARGGNSLRNLFVVCPNCDNDPKLRI